MRDKSLSFNEVYDLYAFRVITQAESHCYQALGAVHNLYKPRPGSFKDYIALPKPNGYQSLHTVLTSPWDVPIEIQIRTEEMDMVAEKGAAAHWLYKATPPDGSTAVRAREWLLKLVESQDRERDSMDFIDTAKAELFPDEVFVFTPRGKIIDLKAHSSALDFAYAIHTDVGNHARRAFIDHQPAPLSTRLENGQTVQIDTDESVEPRPEWLEHVVTAKARTAIRSHLKNLEQADSVAIGHRLLDQALARRDSSLDTISQRKLDRYVRKAGLDRLEDLLVRIAPASCWPRPWRRSCCPSPSAGRVKNRPATPSPSAATRAARSVMQAAAIRYPAIASSVTCRPGAASSFTATTARTCRRSSASTPNAVWK